MTDMTAREAMALHAAVEARRRQFAMPRWLVAAEADISPWCLQQAARGVASPRTREQLAAWLHRHPAPPLPHADRPRSTGEE